MVSCFSLSNKALKDGACLCNVVLFMTVNREENTLDEIVVIMNDFN